MPALPTTVQLGDLSYVLVAQKHTAIKRGMSAIFDSLGDGDVTSGGGMMAVLEAKAYEGLQLFIPTIMPREDFLGTGPAGELHVPTIPQMKDALQKGLEVNGLTGFTALREFIPTELLKALVHQQIAEAVAQSARKSLPSSPSPNGDSPSTTTTPSSPTLTPTGPSDSPIPDSVISSPLETIDGVASSAN